MATIFNKEYYISELQDAGALKDETKAKGKNKSPQKNVQRGLIKVTNIKIGQVLAAIALDSFSNDVILKWIRVGRKITPLIEEQFYMYEQLALYLQNSVQQKNVEKWKTLLNESKFVWPSDKYEGWSKIFGNEPELLAGVEFKPYLSDNGDDNDNEVEDDNEVDHDKSECKISEPKEMVEVSKIHKVPLKEGDSSKEIDGNSKFEDLSGDRDENDKEVKGDSEFDNDGSKCNELTSSEMKNDTKMISTENHTKSEESKSVENGKISGPKEKTVVCKIDNVAIKGSVRSKEGVADDSSKADDMSGDGVVNEEEKEISNDESNLNESILLEKENASQTKINTSKIDDTDNKKEAIITKSFTESEGNLSVKHVQTSELKQISNVSNKDLTKKVRDNSKESNVNSKAEEKSQISIKSKSKEATKAQNSGDITETDEFCFEDFSMEIGEDFIEGDEKKVSEDDDDEDEIWIEDKDNISQEDIVDKNKEHNNHEFNEQKNSKKTKNKKSLKKNCEKEIESQNKDIELEMKEQLSEEISELPEQEDAGAISDDGECAEPSPKKRKKELSSKKKRGETAADDESKVDLTADPDVEETIDLLEGYDSLLTDSMMQGIEEEEKVVEKKRPRRLSTTDSRDSKGSCYEPHGRRESQDSKDSREPQILEVSFPKVSL
ncbi:unnamed protein product [Meganyctiphanes norvegica]|uniref:Uncharacterized protein n=1 Tax=Meganyctiphanes norvegica TaxID=48144 RepID=A0AAV2SYQ1_MEGNR